MGPSWSQVGPSWRRKMWSVARACKSRPLQNLLPPKLGHLLDTSLLSFDNFLVFSMFCTVCFCLLQNLPKSIGAPDNDDD
jgi:hypothetical protein